MKKRVCLTGIGGVIGSNVMEHILTKTDWDIVGIASWKHKGLPERITDSLHYQANRDRVDLVTHDLISPINELTRQRIGDIDYIINVASESHVDRSITDPVSFTLNNTNLILNMLEYARIVKPRLFMQISTDEVYGVAPVGTLHKEWSSTIPSNPYAGSKAAQEAIAVSYWRTYGVPVIITNTMNNFSERQDKEKYIPMVINRVLKDETITIHSYPDKKTPGSRFYLHARNHADALIFLINHFDGKSVGFNDGLDKPHRFNVVGEREVDNLTLAHMIADVLERELKYELVDFHSSRPGHDCRYGLDGSKLKELGWVPPMPFEKSLRTTVLWTVAHPEWLS